MSYSTRDWPCPESWTGDSGAVALADREIVRLLGNCCWFDPPITEQEIQKYAARFQVSKHTAETEIRRMRNGNE